MVDGDAGTSASGRIAPETRPWRRVDPPRRDRGAAGSKAHIAFRAHRKSFSLGRDGRPEKNISAWARHSPRRRSRYPLPESRSKPEMAGILAGASRLCVRAPHARGSAAPHRVGRIRPRAEFPSRMPPRRAHASTDPSPALPPRPAADRGAMMMKIYHASGIALAGTSSLDHRRPFSLSPDHPRSLPSQTRVSFSRKDYDERETYATTDRTSNTHTNVT